MNPAAEYFKGIYDGLHTAFIGMGVTFRHLFTRAVTVQYPEVKKPMPERVRNRLYVNMDDCIGCDQCAKACPVDCITITTIKSTPDVDLGMTSKNTKKRLYVSQFDIDIAKCCYCGLCTYPCPTECIKMTDVYEFSEFDRTNLLYSFSTMTPVEVEAAQARLKKADEEAAAKKAQAAKEAAEKKAADAAAAAANPAPAAAAPAPAAKPAPAPGSNGDAAKPAVPGNGGGAAAAAATVPATEAKKPE
ncbi:MAG: NuoI/complex I 23 kDa subunit family protein [Acidobacteriota bacterium]